jgi:3-methyl-2-oxobutanoate hydroxymethyltransferase
MKQKNEKIVMITAYDYPSGKFVETAKADIILVGDSLSMVVFGYEDTLQVTMQDMIIHSQAVRRGAKDTFIVTDMPYQSFHVSLSDTKRNAMRLIVEGKANAVKLEGGTESRLQAIQEIVDCEIPVVAHLGLTPQSIHTLGGYLVQGKQKNEYEKIFKQAKEIEQAGAFMLVLECIPEQLGKEISRNLQIPTIGIGAGRFCDGQVLVYHDILGTYDFKPKFVAHYMNLKESIPCSLGRFVTDVKGEIFPRLENIYQPVENEENK